jgi:hypothetical protein
MIAVGSACDDTDRSGPRIDLDQIAVVDSFEHVGHADNGGQS